MLLGWGIDVGVASIALSVVELDADGQPLRLIDGQARIFPSALGGEERRGFRSARVQHQRTVWRIEALKQCLIRHLGVSGDVDTQPSGHAITIPADELRADGSPAADWRSDTDRVQLRALGLTEPLSADDLARAILHLARNRGRRLTRSLSDAKKDQDEDKQGNRSIAEVARDTASALRALGQKLGSDQPATPGQLLYQDRQVGKPTRSRKDRLDAWVFTRTQITDELERLLAVQGPVHGLTPEQTAEILESAVWEKDPPAPAIGPCCYGTCDKTHATKIERRLAKATDLAEQKRIYEALNNIRLRDRKTGESRALSLAERDTLAGYALAGETVTAPNLRKWLKLGKGALAPLSSLEEAKGRKGRKQETEVAGHRIAALFRAVFKDADAPDPWQAASALSPTRDALAALLAADEAETVIEGLMAEHGLAPDHAAALADGPPPPVGYIASGRTATAELLAKLKAAVISLYEAEQRCEFKCVAMPELTGGDPLPYYGALFPLACVGGTGSKKDTNEQQFGRIPNPVVHVALNQLRVLAKAMLKRHGPPARINIELARDLHKNAQEREDIDKEIRKNHKKNLEWTETLMRHGGKPTRKNLRAMKLLEWQGGRCLYSGEPIEVSDIVNGDAQVDHILPRVETLDHSVGNLALAKTTWNQHKDKRTPHEAFSGGYKGRDYAAILQQVEQTRKPSLWRFEANALEKFQQNGGFPSRFLADTRYIAKIASKYLSYILAPVPGRDAGWRDVVSLSGGITATMRREWGVDDVIKTLMIEENRIDQALFKPLDDAKAETERRDRLRKIRWDHRHHLLDAIVAACVVRADVQRLNTLLGGGKLLQAPTTASGAPIQRPDSLPWRDDFRHTVLHFLRGRPLPGDRQPPRARVTHKADHGKQGRLHADTFYSVICAVPGEPDLYVTASHKDLAPGPGDLRKQMEIEHTVISSISAAIDAGTIGAYGWGGPDPGAALTQLQKSRQALIDCYDEQLAAQPTQDADGKKIGDATRLRQVLDAVRQQTGQRRFKVYARNSLRVLEPAEQPGRPPRRAVSLSGNDRLVFWLARAEGELPEPRLEVVSTMDANTPDFQEAWQRAGGTLVFRARRGDIVELLCDPDDPHADRALYRLSSFSGPTIDVELTPVVESRSALEARKWGAVRIASIKQWNRRAPCLVVLDADGRERWRSKRGN